MMLRHGAPVVLPFVLGAFACVSTPAPEAASEPVGCWYFERDGAAAELNLPWGIRLSADALTGWPRAEARGDARFAATLSPEAELDHPFGYWMPLPGDSVEVGHPGGGGLALRLGVGEAALSGVARPVGDAMTPGAPAAVVRAVRLTRAQCPAY